MRTQKYVFNFITAVLLFAVLFLTSPLPAQQAKQAVSYRDMEQEVKRLMAEGNIPGVSLVIVKDGQEVFMKGFGYADLENKTPVTPDTLFELGSCSKAFTALAALKCRDLGILDLDAPVSKYLPWFFATYKGKKYPITLRQFLHHTSGIPFGSISLILESTAADALQKTIRKLEGVKLESIPGTRFEYATINYDVVGAVIEQVSGLAFEDFVNKHILTPLGLTHTVVGIDKENVPGGMAVGYKFGFYTTFKYDAPVFRGNTPAGYILSNGKDMARWLQIQTGLVETELDALVKETRQPDQSVPLNMADLSSYGMGWKIFLERFKRVDHNGDNPNFSAHVSFNPVDRYGVAVMANARSKHTAAIANSLMNYLDGKGFSKVKVQEDNVDKGASVVSFMVGFFILAVFIFILSIFYDIVKKRRAFQVPGFKEIGKLVLTLVAYVPFLVGLYLLPMTLNGVSMKVALVFSPVSFKVAILSVVAAMGICYLAMFLSTLFPQKNKYLRSMPLVFVLSLLAGGANAMVIFLITNSVFNRSELFYQVYNFILAFLVYIFGRKLLQTKLIKITFDIVFDMRMKLLEKVFYTSYQKFEKVDRGRVFATLNDDTNRIGGSANVLVMLVTSCVTTMGAFLYLATIAFWATALTLFVVSIIATIYAVVTRRTRVFFEEARDTQNVYMGLLNGMVDGFKELSLQYNKKKEYTGEIGESCDEFRQKNSIALVKFINAFLIGESLLVIVLGAVGYGIPRLFPDIPAFTLIGFIMVLLYLIGPIRGILNSIPAIAQLKISWNRVQEFMRDIPANMDPAQIDALDHSKPEAIQSIEAEGIEFTYDAANENEKFKVGPLDFKAEKGEIVFIIGGNGSGKTTLAKLLTGLYQPEKGLLKVDGKEIDNYRLGEYYSVVFGDFHLFEKLYNVDVTGREAEVMKNLKMLRLEEKVALEDRTFTTIDLSGGQRKRLALLQCYLEDRPIYLFDEVAADQDPTFRKFFYRELLQKMKESGKIVIAITHDDHYFDVADKIVKMDMGKVDVLEEGTDYRVTV